MQVTTVKIEKPENINLILGQSHFVKTVEDIHESVVQTVHGIKFGLAFCEASGEMLVRFTGTDDSMIELAKRNALALSAGHSFILFLGPGFFPINVLNSIKMVPEVCRIFCATSNPVEVVIAETDQGRGILGVIDGGTSEPIENLCPPAALDGVERVAPLDLQREQRDKSGGDRLAGRPIGSSLQEQPPTQPG